MKLPLSGIRSLSSSACWAILLPFVALALPTTARADGERGTVPEPNGYHSSHPVMDTLARAGVAGGIPEISYVKATVWPGGNIQSAIDNGGPGVVLLKNGTYDLWNPIYMKKGVILRGENRNNVKLSVKYRSTWKRFAINFSWKDGCSYAGLEDLTISYDAVSQNPIDGSYANNPHGINDLYACMVSLTASNNWVDSCDIRKSGSDPVQVFGSQNTVRNCYIDQAYNKGDGGHGYFDLRGTRNLVHGNWVRRIRHFAIQQGGRHNVVNGNKIEVDVNFHNGDGGQNLVEYNEIDRPASHPWPVWATGGSAWGHKPPGSGNILFRNDCWDHKSNSAQTSSWNTTYTFWSYGWPSSTNWPVPTWGKYYSIKKLPSPWCGGDIGANGQRGFSSEGGGVWTLKADGEDVWGRNDDFYYVWQPLHGDGEIKVWLHSQPAAHEWAKAGLMIRESLDDGSKQAMLCLTPGHGSSFQYRKWTDAESSAITPDDGQDAPATLRLRRKGDTITGTIWRNGGWQTVGSVDIPMWSEAHIGFFANSHNAWNQTEVKFSDVKVSPLITPNRSNILKGDVLSVNFGQAPGSATDWIGIFKQSDVPGNVSARSWKYLNNSTTAGSVVYKGTVGLSTGNLDPGNYFVAMYKNGSYSQVGDAVSFVVSATPPPSVELEKDVYTKTEAIKANFTYAPGNATDWIGVFAEGETPGTNQARAWVYLNNTQTAGSVVLNGTVSVKNGPGWPLVPGNYFLTLMENGGNNEVVERVPFTVHFDSEAGEPSAPPASATVLIDATRRNGSFEKAGRVLATAAVHHWDTHPAGDVDQWTLWDAAAGGPASASNDSGITPSANASDGSCLAFLQPGNAVYNLTGRAIAEGDTYMVSWKWRRAGRGHLKGQFAYQDGSAILPIEDTETGGAELRTFWRTWTVPAGHPAIGKPIAVTLQTNGNYPEVDEVVLAVAASSDGDGDGIADAFETHTGIYAGPTDTGTDPSLDDTDGDGYDDGVEDNSGTWLNATATGTSPVNADSDDDGLLDGQENPDVAYVAGVSSGTDPNNPDTDGDGFLDGEEFNHGYDPADNATFPANVTTFVYDVSDRFATNAVLSTDNWTGGDLPNWIAGIVFNDLYARNNNDGNDRITRGNNAGFSYSVPVDATRITFDVDLRVNGNYCSAALTTSGADTLGLGYDPSNSKFFILDGATRIDQAGTTAPLADSRKTLRLVVELQSQTADLILDPAGTKTVVMENVPLSVTAGSLHAADGLSTNSKSRYTGVYRYSITTLNPIVTEFTYDEWAAGFGLNPAPNSNGTPDSDADLDGRSNLLEFATNDDPNSGIPSGKVSTGIRDISGVKVLTLTLPVRGTATPFSGSSQQVSDPVDGIVYRIQGSNDLSDWNSTVISEVVPPLSAGLPALNEGWEYRTFRVQGDVGSNPRCYIRAMIETAP